MKVMECWYMEVEVMTNFLLLSPAMTSTLPNNTVSCFILPVKPESPVLLWDYINLFNKELSWFNLMNVYNIYFWFILATKCFHIYLQLLRFIMSYIFARVGHMVFSFVTMTIKVKQCY